MRQKIKAYLFALVSFAVLTTGENLYLKYHPLMTGDDIAIFIFNLSGFLSFIVPGYVAALMVRQQGILTGLVSGLLVSLAFFLYILFFRHVIHHDWYWGFAFGTVLGGFGGLIWALQALVMRFTRPREQIK